jgi:hypothetical protein
MLDGHGSHVILGFIEFSDQKKALLAVYSPHSTQTLQPVIMGFLGGKRI